MIKHKHPWEYKMHAVKGEKPTAEEFAELIKKATAKDEKEIKPSGYMMIDGVPHKFKNGRWNPLTKLNQKQLQNITYNNYQINKE